MSSSLLRPLAIARTHSCRRSSSTPIRRFHSPFIVLGNSRKAPPPPTSSELSNPFTIYEKQCDVPPEPLAPTFGNRTYVVSQPDASASHYEVPSGAYPTSSPYVNPTPTEAPNANDAQVSSTSSALAHELTTRVVPQHPGGVGASAAVRYRSAPGKMGEQGGSFGGMDLMDKEGTTVVAVGERELAEKNPQPDSEVAEKYSKAGVDGAWKLRK